MINNFFSWSDYGFCSAGDFAESLLKIRIANLLLIITIPAGFFTEYFGLSLYVSILLGSLFLLELITGLLKSVSRNIKIKSRPLQRFGLKVLVYVFFMFLFKGLSNEYDGKAEGVLYGYLHSFVVLYVVGVYSVSVLENIGVITKNRKEFANLIKKVKSNTGQK